MNPTELFSGIAGYYEQARPAYSDVLIEDMFQKYGLGSDSVVADVGAGTGKFAKQMIERGAFVYCVEPNDDMRDRAVSELRKYKNCMCVKGDAEFTNLENRSVNDVTAAQAFHWFDAAKFREECQRILKPDGKVFLIWNMRDANSPLTKENETICRKYCAGFKGFGGGIEKDDMRIIDFFHNDYEKAEYDHPLYYDRETFLIRCLSSSYSLREGNPNFEKYVQELESLFDKFSVNGSLTMQNKTVMYLGTVA